MSDCTLNLTLPIAFPPRARKYNARLLTPPAIGSKWATAWSQTDVSAWTSIYADKATYTDYAFGFIRRGKPGLGEHFTIWRKAHPDFRMEVVEVWPEIVLDENLVKHSIRTRNVGTFTCDLPTMKASGKTFEFYAVVDLVVGKQDGLIVKVQEWYHRQFDADRLVERDI